jgi:hypothetical protein
MSQVINWIRNYDSNVVYYYEAIYGSFEHELNMRFYTRSEYEARYHERIHDERGFDLLDYWNSGDCEINERQWMPSISHTTPMWSEVAQNSDPTAPNYVVLPEQAAKIIKNRYEEILSGEIKALQFTCASDQYFAFNTGIVETQQDLGEIRRLNDDHK